MTTQKLKNNLTISPGSSHPSGIEDEGELAFVSMEFWMMEPNGVDAIFTANEEVFNRLLAFQLGWQAAKNYYKIYV